MKVGVIGAAGKVGSAVSYSLVGKVDELCLIDIVKDPVEGESVDMGHAADGRTKLSWGGDAAEAKGCDVVVIPSGFPRTPDMKTRMDLVQKNAPIVKDVVTKVVQNSPKAILIIITNPMDVMSYLAYKVSGFDASRVIGMGGTLDSRRLRYALTKRFGQKADAITIGEHGDGMIPVLSQARIGGKPIDKAYVDQNREAIIAEVKGFGPFLIQKKGGTWWGPAQSTVDIIDAIQNGPKTIPVSTLYQDVYVGLPAEIGRKGVMKAAPPAMDSWEKTRFDACVKGLAENCRWVDQWLKS